MLSCLLFLCSIRARGDDLVANPPKIASPEELVGSSLIPTDRPYLILAVHWEGRDIKHLNVDSLAAFRSHFPEIPVMHFISPAYFLRSPAEALMARQKIRMVSRPGDTFGLALGGWRSLVKKAHAIYRNGPTFWGESLREKDCQIDCGLEIPINIYSEEELMSIMSTAILTLEENGFGKPKALVVSGWVASRRILEVASKVGIKQDFSSVSLGSIQRTIEPYPLKSWVEATWQNSTVDFLVRKINTLSNFIVEVPQSVPGMDYMTKADALKAFHNFRSQLSQKNNQAEMGKVFQIVMHQETMHQTAPRAFALMQEIIKDPDVHNQSLVFWHNPEKESPKEQEAGPMVH